MFCKHCGKQIADDSTFCQYCGGKLDGLVTIPQKSSEQEARSIEPIDASISTKEDNPIKVEVTKNKTNNSPAIANEIVGNLKMMGFGLILSIFYILIFMAIKSHEARPLIESGYLGESCYDPTNISGGWMFLWEQHYAISVCCAPDYTKQSKSEKLKSDFANIRSGIDPISSADMSIIMQSNSEGALNFAKGIAERKHIPQDELEYMKEKAKLDAQKDKEDFQDEISYIRKSAYERDLAKNSKYSIIICITALIFGRYLVKLTKWVNSNKTT